MRWMLILCVLAACSKSEKKADPPNKTAEGASAVAPAEECEAAAKRGVEATIAKRRAGNTQPLTPQEQEIPKRLAPALAKTCVEAKWSPEVIACFKTADDIATCKNMLTPEQRGMYTRAAMEAMGMGMGGSGMPLHGMPPHGMPPAAPPAGSAAPPAPPAGSGSN